MAVTTAILATAATVGSTLYQADQATTAAEEAEERANQQVRAQNKANEDLESKKKSEAMQAAGLQQRSLLGAFGTRRGLSPFAGISNPVAQAGKTTIGG